MLHLKKVLLLTFLLWAVSMDTISAEETIRVPNQKADAHTLEHRSASDYGAMFDQEHHWMLPSAVVLIDAGHGGIDGGASYDSLLEKDINLAIAKKLYLLLRSQGIVAVLNRTGDYALSDDNRWHASRSRHTRDLSQRKQLTEEIPIELLISLHVNWTKNKSKHGPLVLHQNNGESSLLAFCIQDALNRQQHTTFYPRVGKPFYLLNRVKHPSVIVEMGFISHSGDRTMLTNSVEQTKIANAILSGLRQYKLITH